MIKRLFDIILSLLGLLVLSPLMVILAFLVRVKLGSPSLFRQMRPGKSGKLFELLKFRTMTNLKDENGELLPDRIRLTQFGRFLRSTSLDELPTLWNVLKGEMSLVGPRPLLPEYLPLYNQQQAHRHDVRPGITGWAQINGRNAITWEEKFELDVWYVNNQSIWLDIKIILITLRNVIRKKDISADSHVTMPKFTGSHSNTYHE